jgi:bifunctional DNA-binding transcriptional regulator/antitoxin component of YhaV-PrlF toxin-antitoxin module
VVDRLAGLSEAPADPPRWWHSIAGVDAAGRLRLPVEARQLAAGLGAVSASSNGDVVVLRRDGIGAATPVDPRGRVLLPAWLRRRVGHAGTVFVATRRPDASTVVLAPASALDRVADALVGEVG